MYYLNAFNEMLRKRQRQNMMGGEGYQGDAAPSGPMGARQSGGGMSGVRNALSNPFVSFAASMIPAARAPFAVAQLGMSAYDRFQANQNPYADDSMDRLSFNAPAYGQAGPEYGPYADDSMDRLSFNAPSPVAPQSSFAGEALAPMAPEAISSPIGQSSFTGESLAPMGAVDYGSRMGGAMSEGDFSGLADGTAFNQGGMVTPERLMGRAPAPDDGYGALQGGEYVITKAAVEKYGKRLLDAINNGTFR